MRPRSAMVLLAAAILLSAGCAHRSPLARPPADQSTRERAAESRQMRFLAAFEHAGSIEIVSLAAREAELDRRWSGAPEGVGASAFHARLEDEIDAEWCSSPDACIDGNRVLGRVRIVDAGARRELTGHLRSWLVGAPTDDSACIPQYRHAVLFESRGVRHRALLCYACGQYVLRDGPSVREPENRNGTWSQAASAPGRGWFAQRFAAAGIPVEVPR